MADGFSNALSSFMQARRDVATQRLMGPAMSGDLEALNRLMTFNPEAGQMVGQRLTMQQQQEEQRKQQEFENQLATQRMGLAERELAMQAQAPQRSSLKAFQPQLMENPETGELQMMVPVVDEATGQARWEPIAGGSGFGVAKETPEQERKREAESKARAAGMSATATKTAERDQGWIDSGVDAQDQLPDIERMIELNDVIKTGGWAGAAVKAADVFGYTPANEGEFRQLQRTMVLGQLKKAFTGAISDAEREFLSSAMADLEQGKEVNRRTLERMKAINERSIKRAKAAAKRQGIDWEEYVGSGGSAEQPASAGGAAKFLGFE